MDDMIIKGTGNSRWLKSVANIMTLYPTYESFAEALAAGTFPIDLNGINPAGVEQAGTKLSKSNLLSDATATGMGLTASATPDQALAKLRQLIKGLLDSEVKLQIVSYVGTGTYGINNPCSITFSFAPKIVMFLWARRGYKPTNTHLTHTGIGFNNSSGNIIVCDNITTSFKSSDGFSCFSNNNVLGKKSIDGKTFSWYFPNQDSNGANYQLNENYSNDTYGVTTYYFAGIG